MAERDWLTEVTNRPGFFQTLLQMINPLIKEIYWDRYTVCEQEGYLAEREPPESR